MWDLNARSHEITLLKNKHIRLDHKYGEVESLMTLKMELVQYY